MSYVPNGVILPFDGLNASIPANWERVTSLDGKYPKGHGSENPNTSGGSNTHTHTSTAHGHNMDSHNHSYDLAYIGDFGGASLDETLRLASAHGHPTASTSATTGGSLQNQSVTWSSVNHEPPYYAVIFIRPAGTVAFVSSGILVHFNKANVPTGWLYCDGNNGTPDLRNKYLKGAAAGANAGAGGGATSHSHTISHTHTVNAHSHSGTSANNDYQSRIRRGDDHLDVHAFSPHTHAVSLANATATINDYTNTGAGSNDTIDLEYKKVGILRNNGGALLPGMIGMCLSTNIPIGWVLCDGNNGTLDMRNKFIKVGANLAENNQTGGSNTHTHSAVSHNHTAASSHTHSGSTGGASAYYRAGGAPNEGIVGSSHTHPVQNISSITATYTNTNIDCSTNDHQPTYLTVAYVEFKFNVGGLFI